MGTGNREGPQVRTMAGEVDERPLLSFDDVAVRLNLKRRTVESYAHQGLLPFIKVGRHTRFEPAMVDEFIKSRRDAA